jgi:predicted Zn-dependent peptidase
MPDTASALSSAPALIRSDALSNGVRVITEFMPHVRSVTVGIWIAAGSRREVGPENGIAHFIEHMLFKGTTKRSAEDIAREVDSIGGNLDAFTAKELVCFNAKVLDEHLSIVFDILADLVLHPLFAAEDIEKEKGVILEELKMEVDNPEYLVHELFSAAFWKGHALGKPILGTKETVRGFTRDMVLDYYRRAYAPRNIVITAAGNVGHEELLELAERHFAGEDPGDVLPAERAPSPQAKLTLKNKRSLEQVHVCLGVPCYAIPHEQRYACYVLNTLLGGGMSSRLFQNIREKRGLAYAVFTEQYLYRDGGCMSVYAGTSLKSAREVIDLILAEFRELKQTPVPADELRRAKDHMKGSLVMGLESTSSRMSNLARQYMYFGRFFSLDEMVARIEEVDAETIRGICNDFFVTDRVALTVLGNLSGFVLSRDELAC